MISFYNKKNGQKLPAFYYPSSGNRNVLRKIPAGAVKLRSFTGKQGRGFTAQLPNGLHRSYSDEKVVASL
ncbi:MAG: hypothetical protein VW270_27835 [Candidatus Poseidoniales archaeon]